MLLALFVPLASAGAQDDGPDGDQLSAQDVAEDGGTLDATPESVTNLVPETGTATTPQEHTIDVEVADDGDDPTDEAVTVIAQVEDPSGNTSYDGGLPPGTTNSEECTEGDTGEDCQVTLSGVILQSGKDRIRVFRDDNPQNAQFDEGEDFDWVNKTWAGPEDEADTERLGGSERIETAVRISQDHWLNADGTEFEAATHREAEQAQHVVIARADEYPDALAGAPLAVREEGPLLLTFPDELHSMTQDELERVLGADDDDDVDVYILGNSNAISIDVQATLEEDYDVERLGGTTRIETAIEIAKEIDGLQGGTEEQRALTDLLIASAENFPDAMVGGAAAANVDPEGGTVGAVLLSWEDSKPDSLEDYLAGFDEATTSTWALGGTGVNPYSCQSEETVTECDQGTSDDEADESADTAVYGAERLETARAVAEVFFDGPVDVGIARADLFPDTLTGGAHIGQFNGPVVLTFPEQLSEDQTERYLCHTADTIEHAYVYGGDQAVSETAKTAADNAIDGEDCGPYDQPGRQKG